MYSVDPNPNPLPLTSAITSSHCRPRTKLSIIGKVSRRESARISHTHTHFLYSPSPENKFSAKTEMKARSSHPFRRTLAFLMGHLCHVSQRGDETGMTAKNLAIVWAPNLLRNKHVKHQSSRTSSQNQLQDIAVQAACTEFLIDHYDLLFSRKLPAFSQKCNFELGIELSTDGDGGEIDIDGAIAAKEKEEKNGGETDKVTPSPPENKKRFRQSTLERSKSSVIVTGGNSSSKTWQSYLGLDHNKNRRDEGEAKWKFLHVSRAQIVF